MPLTSPKPLPSQTSSLAPWISEVHDLLSPAAGAWTDYSSGLTITATATNPTKGAGTTYLARWSQFGKTVQYTFKVTIGAGFGAGSGSYNFSLPVAAQAGRVSVGSVYVNDSGTALRVGVCVIEPDATHLRVLLSNLTLVPLDSAGPGTAWAAGDSIQGSITYEAA